MAATFPLSVVIGAVDRVTAPLRRVQSSFAGFGAQLSRIGAGLSASVTAPLAAFAALSVKAGIDTDRALRKIAASSGATAEEIAAMHAAVRALPPDLGMRRGVEVLEALTDEGVSAANSLKLLEITAQLAKAANIGNAEAGSLVADTLDAVGESADQGAELIDSLTKATGGSTSNLRNYVAALQGAGPAARAAGIGFKDQIATIKAFASVGLEGSQASAALRTGVAALVRPTTTAVAAFQKLKLNRGDILDANGQVRDLASTLELLRSNGAQAGDLIDIFGAKAGLAFSRLDPSAIRAARAELEQVGGSTAARAAQASTGAAAAFDRLSNSFDKIRDAIAQSGLLDFVATLFDVLSQTLEAVSQVSPAFLKWAVIIGAVAAAIGPVLIIVGQVAAGIGALSGAVGFLTPIFAALAAFATGTLVPAISAIGAAILATPIGWLLAGLAAIVTAGYFVWKHWDKISRFLLSAFRAWSVPWRMGLDWLLRKIPAVADLIPDWLANLIGLKLPAAAATGAAAQNAAGVAAASRVETTNNAKATVRLELGNLPPGSSVSQSTEGDSLDLELASGLAAAG